MKLRWSHQKDEKNDEEKLEAEAKTAREAGTAVGEGPVNVTLASMGAVAPALSGDELGDDEGIDETQRDTGDKLGRRKLQVQALEIAVNGAEYAERLGELTHTVGEGAAQTQEAANTTMELADAGAIDLNAVSAAVQQTGIAPQDIASAAQNAGVVQDAGAGAEGATTSSEFVGAVADKGLENGAEQFATDQIVEGHHCFEIIDGTCLELPVRGVAEHCAVPLYKCMAESCFKCCCGGSTAENVNSTAEGAGTLNTAADGTGEGVAEAEGCCDAVCGFWDMADWCVCDEILTIALPILGVCFSCFRLYQGSKLTCRGSTGICNTVGAAKTGFKWMLAEGHARLWQGFCGLLGAAPGLIIVTLPSIIALSVVASKARRKRRDIEKAIAEITAGEQTNAVVTTQPFESEEQRKEFYGEAYKAAIGKEASPEAMELGATLVPPVYIYPNAPRGEWSTGVYDCCDHFPSFCETCICGCVTAGQVAEGARLFKGVFWVTVVVFAINCIFELGFVLWLIFGTYIIAKSRSRIARVYDIKIDPLGNCCLAFWCSCCTVTQVARHLFGWGKKAGHTGRCGGCCACGPRPVSRWDTMPRRGGSSNNDTSVSSHYGSVSFVPAAPAVVLAPSAVAPMAREKLRAHVE